MTIPAQTFKQFAQDSYQLISANSPTTQLQGSDVNDALNIANRLLTSYSSSSLLLPIAQKVQFTVNIGQQYVTFGDPAYTPTPNVTVGRLTNLERAWLNLGGVDYPLIDEDRGVFYGSYKYEPQQGLPRFAIITNDLDLTTIQLYPSPSQQYTLFVYGKFQLSLLTENSLMSIVPQYMQRYLQLALARDLSIYKGRSSAWTPKLEQFLQEAKDDLESCSTMDLVIDSANESYLNGSYRLRAGI